MENAEDYFRSSWQEKPMNLGSAGSDSLRHEVNKSRCALIIAQYQRHFGEDCVLNVSLRCKICFSNPQSDAFIGVAVRSQNFLASFVHLIYLKRNGSIVIAEPNEVPPNSYEDRMCRGPTPTDEAEFDEGKMPKVFGPGLVRFKSFRTGWG